MSNSNLQRVALEKKHNQLEATLAEKIESAWNEAGNLVNIERQRDQLQFETGVTTFTFKVALISV